MTKGSWQGAGLFMGFIFVTVLLMGQADGGLLAVPTATPGPDMVPAALVVGAFVPVEPVDPPPSLTPAQVAIADITPTPAPSPTPLPSPTPTSTVTSFLRSLFWPARAATMLPGVHTFGQHITQRGDSLYRIAEQYDTTIEVIAQLNNLSPPYTILVGQVLTIPGTEGAVARLPLTARPTQPAQAPSLTPPISTVTATVVSTLSVVGIVPVGASATINGVDSDVIAVMPPEVRENVRAIFVRGRDLGVNARAFSRLGDSVSEAPHFLYRFDDGAEAYHLGDYAYLQPVIDHFAGSFRRQGVAVRRGLHTWSVFDPGWAPKPTCSAGENLLACEIRLNRPAVLFVRLGSNDRGVPNATERNLRRIIEYAIEQGVIPVMGTKGDRREGSNINNEIIMRLAEEYRVPLWDFDRVAATIPGKGLGSDGVHMTTYFAHDYRNAQAFQRGYSLMNLSALVVMEQILTTVADLLPSE